jgi:hypothetical protein
MKAVTNGACSLCVLISPRARARRQMLNMPELSGPTFHESPARFSGTQKCAPLRPTQVLRKPRAGGTTQTERLRRFFNGLKASSHFRPDRYGGDSLGMRQRASEPQLARPGSPGRSVGNRKPFGNLKFSCTFGAAFGVC